MKRGRYSDTRVVRDSDDSYSEDERPLRRTGVPPTTLSRLRTSLCKAAGVAKSEHRCLAALHLALAELQEHALKLSAGEQQAILDAALEAAMHNNKFAACLAAVRLLAGQGAHPGQFTALHSFLHKQQHSTWEGPQVTALLAALLAAGADHSARNSSGLSALDLAARLPDPAAVTAAIAALLAAGASAQAVPSAAAFKRRTPLHSAALNEDPKAAREAIVALLAAGADPMATDTDGKLALDLAASNANSEGMAAATQALATGMAASCQKARVELDNLQTCTVCMDKARTTAFFPCGHFAFCSACAAALAGRCSVCRAEQCTMQTVCLS